MCSWWRWYNDLPSLKSWGWRPQQPESPSDSSPTPQGSSASCHGRKCSFCSLLSTHTSRRRPQNDPCIKGVLQSMRGQTAAGRFEERRREVGHPGLLAHFLSSFSQLLPSRQFYVLPCTHFTFQDLYFESFILVDFLLFILTWVFTRNTSKILSFFVNEMYALKYFLFHYSLSWCFCWNKEVWNLWIFGIFSLEIQVSVVWNVLRRSKRLLRFWFRKSTSHHGQSLLLPQPN